MEKSTKSKTVKVNRFIAKMVNDFTNKTSRDETSSNQKVLHIS